MPWHVAENAYGCSGYAVVKDGTNEVVGCHPTREAANRQLAALHASGAKSADGYSITWSGSILGVDSNEL